MANTIIEFMILAVVVVVLMFVVYDYLHPWMPEDEDESWTCDNCGYTVFSVSLEGLVEGIKIHNQIYPCGEEDENES